MPAPGGVSGAGAAGRGRETRPLSRSSGAEQEGWKEPSGSVDPGTSPLWLPGAGGRQTQTLQGGPLGRVDLGHWPCSW